ncbi:MAG TPA: hypothetical protein VFX16_37870 [Pseudonocardiaceae bacterium]|nr:hypothetical protein [Pseudonocardiaceae bacterium]
MPLPNAQPAPRAVRIAGVLVAVQGLTALAFAIAVFVRALSVSTGAGNLFGEVGYYTVLALGILAVAGGLLLGLRWARTPATLLQLLLIAVAWYAIGPSNFVALAIITVFVCIATLVLLFLAPSRAWAVVDRSDA